jgi:hypothetical protein
MILHLILLIGFIVIADHIKRRGIQSLSQTNDDRTL